MDAHVGHITRVCFMMLRQIRAVAAYLPSFATRILVTSLVISKLDYCNSVLVGLPKTLTRRLQSVVNAAAKLVMRKHKYDHITPSSVNSIDWGSNAGLNSKRHFFDSDHLLRRSSSFRPGDSNVLGQVVYGCWPNDLEPTSTSGHIRSNHWKL